MKPPLNAAVRVLVAVFFATLATGCGADEATRSTPISLQQPETPKQADCGLTGAGSERESDAPPKPGTYTYDLDGRRRVVSDTTTTRQLPSTMRVVVTDSLRRGGQSCYAMQRRYAEALGETGVFVINGSDYYMRSGTFQAGGDITQVVPDPSILMLSGDQLQWSGTFHGATSGRYRATIIGRKRVDVGGKSVSAAGVQTHLTYSGEIDGREDAERWVAIDSGLVLAETVSQRRAFGLDTLKLDFKSRLTSLDPE